MWRITERYRTQVRNKIVIEARPPSGGNWANVVGAQVAITQPLTGPTKTIPVADTGAFSVGEWVTLRADVTAEFIEDLNMTDFWGSPSNHSSLGGPLFYRQINICPIEISSCSRSSSPTVI